MLSERDKHDSRVRQRRESRAPQASLATACGAARRFEHARTGTMSHVAAAAVPSATRVCAPRARNATAAAAGRPPFRAVARARGASSGRAPGMVVSFPRAATRLRAAAGDAGAGDAEGASPAPEADAFPRFEGVAGEDLAGAIEALKAADIKSELARFGANTAGAKALLVERLARCYELKREGKDVQAELRRRTLDRLGEAEAAETEALRRREARRRRAGGYSSAAAAAAAKAGGARKVVKLKRSRGKGIPVTATGSRKASNSFAADVDLSEGADQEPEADKYKLENPLTGRRRLNVVRRDLDRQGAFQETMTEEGWYMVSVPETREERAAELISALSESARVGGVAIDAWTPRAPAADFAVAESEANGLSRLELLKRVPPEEQGSEKPFPGFILLYLSGMNQKLLGALEEVYPFKGFAAGGITRYGNTRKQKSEAPRTVPQAQLEQMMRACEPRVVSDEAFAEMQAEKKAREAAEAAEGGKEGSLEAAMGTLEVASPEEVAAARRDAADDAAPASEPSEERAASTAPPGAQTVEVYEGPFKGFKGYVTARRDDGSVDATLTIFGRETAVSLEASEFAFS